MAKGKRKTFFNLRTNDSRGKKMKNPFFFASSDIRDPFPKTEPSLESEKEKRESERAREKERARASGRFRLSFPAELRLGGTIRTNDYKTTCSDGDAVSR